MKNEIQIPIEIANPDKLSLEEIGTIAVLMMYPNFDETMNQKWNTEQDLERVVKTLSERNILKMKGDKLDIDLRDKDFFHIADYDQQDNPIYEAYSPWAYDEEGSPIMWRVRPELWDMKVIWINCSDAELIGDDSELTFDSLEDAEKYFREENEGIARSEKDTENYYKKSKLANAVNGL